MKIYPGALADSAIGQARDHLSRARYLMVEGDPYGRPCDEVIREFAIHEELAAIRAALTETPRPRRWWRRGGSR